MLVGKRKIKGIPSGEIIWLQYLVEDEVKFIVTSTIQRDKYKLYKVENGVAVNTKRTSNNPIKLEKYFKEPDS